MRSTGARRTPPARKSSTRTRSLLRSSPRCSGPAESRSRIAAGACASTRSASLPPRPSTGFACVSMSRAPKPSPLASGCRMSRSSSTSPARTTLRTSTCSSGCALRPLQSRPSLTLPPATSTATR
eukprot:Amastigsp_a843318_215.p5 type:complete len:125 gc:universal Amastigsp_a843318_215:1039-665(-)